MELQAFRQFDRFRVAVLFTCLAACCTLSPGLKTLAAAGDPFPEIAPATRVQAVHLISHDTGDSRHSCLTTKIQAARNSGIGIAPAFRQALSLLGRRAPLGEEQIFHTPEGVSIRVSTEDPGLNLLWQADADGDGTPDILQTITRGLQEAGILFGSRLELPPLSGAEIVLAELDDGLDGYLIKVLRPAKARIVLDISPAGGLESLRRATIHQYAHAVALEAHPRFPAAWGEALAVWANLAIDEALDTQTRALLSERLGRLAEGLLPDELDLAAGNALWLAYLHEAYGPFAVRQTIEELAAGAPIVEALDLAVRRASSADLRSALREFHLWSMLVGARSDNHHFSFARQLEAPAFSSVSEGLPALSVQADPPVAPLGLTQVLIEPESAEGGITVRFEGEFSISWGVDLLLLKRDGTKHRLAMALNEGNAEKTLPLDGLEQIWLLIRNMDPSLQARYSYTAFRQRGFPYDLAYLEAVPSGGRSADILISWESLSESHLYGYNVLRTREDGSTAMVINPVWIPALGDQATPTSYRFVDRTAQPGVSYSYRIQGITKDGLTSLSEPVHLKRSR